jgi:uncharacterized membrane protein (Fun14 family)
VERDVTKALDVDNDGKFTTNDVKVIVKRFLDILTNRLPSSTGFAVSFYYGFKK